MERTLRKDEFREIGRGHIVLFRSLFMRGQRQFFNLFCLGFFKFCFVLFCLNVNGKNSVERE